jgi:hypothetical protein
MREMNALKCTANLLSYNFIYFQMSFKYIDDVLVAAPNELDEQLA